MSFWHIQVQGPDGGGQGNSDWLVREMERDRRGRSSDMDLEHLRTLSWKQPLPVSVTEHSGSRWFRKHFETPLNLGKAGVLAESFFKGERETIRGKSAQRSVHFSGAAVAVRLAAWGWHLSPDTTAVPPSLLVPPPRPSFLLTSSSLQ